MENILIFTDGSSRGNPGPGGWGAIVAADDTVFEVGGGEKMTTNNRMELTAAIKALEALDKKFPGGNVSAIINTDSQYLINGITKWIYGWIKNNWKSSQKEDVLNRDLWELLQRAVSQKKIQWNYVRGHMGHDANERCDEIATAYADGVKPKLYDGSRKEYPVLISVSNSLASEKIEPAYLCLINGKVERFKTWAECEAKVKGKPGVKYKKVKSTAEEKRILKEWLPDENGGHII